MSRDDENAARGAQYPFFRHTGCIYFPCHETAHPEDFNCMFCYCPLYALGEGCGGNYRYLENGIKDCSDCLIPHSPDSAEYIWSRFEDIKCLAGRKGEK